MSHMYHNRWVTNCHLFSLYKCVIISEARLTCLFFFSDSFEDWHEAQKITSALLEGRCYENLIDFDNHLDDLRNDWTNPVINKSVLDLC